MVSQSDTSIGNLCKVFAMCGIPKQIHNTDFFLVCLPRMGDSFLCNAVYKHGTITIHNTDMRAEIFMCITPWCCEYFNGGNGYQPDPQTNLWLFNVKETTLWLVSPPLRVVSQIFQFLAIFMIPYLGNYQQEWNDVYTKLLLV